MSNDGKVEVLRDARLQVSVESTGPSFRPDCFKEFELNLPYAPQTVSYRISQNYDVQINQNKLSAKNVLSTTQHLKEELEDKINFGCKAEVVGMLMMKGELENGDAFKSSPNVFLKNGQFVLQTGSVQTSLSNNSTTSVTVTPTIFFGQDWNMIWDEADSYTDTPQYNY